VIDMATGSPRLPRERTAIAIQHRPLPSALRFSAELGRALVGKIEPDLFYSAQ
jgi:hypothetical protein